MGPRAARKRVRVDRLERARVAHALVETIDALYPELHAVEPEPEATPRVGSRRWARRWAVFRIDSELAGSLEARRELR